MVKFFDNAYSYEYSLPTVSLAYFIRYPNPYARHVISTDVIERRVDTETGRLHTTRLLKKQSRLPPAVMSLLPKNILGTGPRGPSGEAQNFILEKSVVDLHEGWMETETQNLQYRGVLSVVEKQRYDRPRLLREQTVQARLLSNSDGKHNTNAAHYGLVRASQDGYTEVTTNVTFKSRFGLRKRGEDSVDSEEKKGFLASWSTNALQRTIESTSLNRTMKGLAKSREGMNIVLLRIREGGVVGALEGMRRDRELANTGLASVE